MADKTPEPQQYRPAQSLAEADLDLVDRALAEHKAEKLSIQMSPPPPPSASTTTSPPPINPNAAPPKTAGLLGPGGNIPDHHGPFFGAKSSL